MQVDPRLLPHNLHWSSVRSFSQLDPTLRKLKDAPLVGEASLLAALPLDTPGIYTLVGGRQVGKSTLCKQSMQRLLQAGEPPESIAYVTCEPFRDAEELRIVLQDLLEAMAPAVAPARPTWLFVDEVTYVPGWDRTVKFLADAGAFERCFLLLTGSDHVVIQDSLKRLPGRRGAADQVDFHLRPLSFLDYCRLRRVAPGKVLESLAAVDLGEPVEASDTVLAALEGALRDYHGTGGFLPAINDVARAGEVKPATLRTYAEWIRGDMLRLERSERYLREVVAGIDRRYGSQVSWTSLSKELSIDHPKTVADYVGLLERMDAVVVAPAVAEHLRGPAPKKARKVFFADPFIHRALRAWLGESDAGIEADARLQRDLEATFAAHVQRFTEGYYVKGQGEVDCAWYERGRLQLLEVKWAVQLRPEELKEIRRRGCGVIAARTSRGGDFDGISVVPAAVALLRLAARAAKAQH
jgi:predicted AAA+ superfamily ATPase